MIDEPQVLLFVRERISPRCEQLRAVIAGMRDDLKSWPNVEASVPNDDKEKIGENGGSFDRNGADVHTAIAIFDKILSSGISDLTDEPVINRFCNRPLLG